jgi:hypothetical protein
LDYVPAAKLNRAYSQRKSDIRKLYATDPIRS